MGGVLLESMMNPCSILCLLYPYDFLITLQGPLPRQGVKEKGHKVGLHAGMRLIGVYSYLEDSV